MCSSRSLAGNCGTEGRCEAMFKHVFSYRLKCLLRNRELVFWTLAFSLLLATLFHFTIGHLTEKLESFNPIRVAVVDSQAYRKDIRFHEMLESLSQPGEAQILELTVADEQEAERLLADGAVTGIITVDQAIGLTVKKSGIEQSVLKAILDEYAYTSRTVTSVLAKNPAVAQQLIAELGDRRSYTEQISFSNAKPDTILGFFYALIAMACMYSSFWGLRNAIDVQADLSARGARRSVAPTHKLGVVLSDAAAALIISFAEVLILLAYMAFVLRISFGNQIGYVLLTCLAGCVAGVSFGGFIGTVVRGSENAKTGILIGVSMTMSFLAGLMWVEVKDIVARKAPVLSYINPAALISDAFYSLYVFDSHRRFFINIGMLCLLSAIMCTASFMQLRRERYASV
jgi:ABC-2 type transport system permease protein